MKIDPKYVNGEPYCSSECGHFSQKIYKGDFGMCNINVSIVAKGCVCIPALKRDRDQAIKERDEARREICKKDAYPKNVWLARSLRRG